MRHKSFAGRFLMAVAIAGITAMFCARAEAAITYQVDVYSGHTQTGDGTPFSGLVSSTNVEWMDYSFIVNYGPFGQFTLHCPAMAPSGVIDFNSPDWHPNGLQNFGATLTGWFTAYTERDYFFATNSDDGSILYVDGKPTVDNGGGHSPQTVAGTIHLLPGTHEITVNFFEDFGGASGVTALLDPGLIPTSQPATVPIIPSGLLLLSGLSGMAAKRFRKNNI
ncbi:MAG TPA: PA14 domain-containing protein [Geobacteraceae bacterium]|nr:PA14 domain-containing protein [Geobacteraceae bacterium]